MKSSNYKFLAYLGTVFVFSIISCNKNWLEEKPDKSFVVPSSIEDYQALLDNSVVQYQNTIAFNAFQISLGEMSAGDFILTDNVWRAAPNRWERNAYLWKPEIYEGESNITDWNNSYKKLMYLNIIHEGIETIMPKDIFSKKGWNQVKGSACFYRAYVLFDLAQVYCKPYSSANPEGTLGIPVRVESDIYKQVKRSSLKETYDQIVSDLNIAKDILPVLLPNSTLYKIRPTKVAALGMLARVYLSMQKYDSAFYYANECLEKYNLLKDYNDIDPNSLVSFAQFGEEVILHMVLSNYYTIGINSSVHPSLYALYDQNDLRKKLFFTTRFGTNTFKGSYDMLTTKFSGLATDEMYLIRSECNARRNNKDDALADLNHLLKRRWVLGTFNEITANDSDEALAIILKERRKELCFRGLRWTDLRRLNMDNRFETSLIREIEGVTYQLPPNNNRYVLPIPDDIITFSGIQQNPRN